MKRTISILLALALLLGLLPACGQKAVEQEAPAEEPEAVFAARELVETVFPASGKDGALEVERLNVDEDADRLEAYIEAICRLTPEQWEDAAVIRGMGASAFEIVVLRLGDEEAAGDLETVLVEYLTVREGAFTGYAPDEAEMASNGKVRREGQYVGLFICPDPAGAEAMFAAACRGEVLPALPEPAAEPEPAEEADTFTPVVELRDILFRLCMEAAYPEWIEHTSVYDEDSLSYSSQKEMSEIFFGIPMDQYEEYCYTYWYLLNPHPKLDDYTSREVIIFLAGSEEGAAELVQMLEDYRATHLEHLQAAADDGAEDAAEAVVIWENAQTVQAGRYAALIASDHTEEAALLFPRIVSDPATQGSWELWRFTSINNGQSVMNPDPDYPDRVRFTPPEEEDMSIYDTSAILAAWEKKDPSALRGYDREVYDMAADILPDDDLSDPEKEEAVYRWLVNNVNYDWSHQDALAETERWSYEPYGALVKRAAVCLGYAAAFQLLMDMSGVECITVVGASSNSTVDHAWNMVRLGGQWYCVDVTWDANAREQFNEEREWLYFNITSDEMAKSHQWDYANTPEATAEDRGGAA